MRSVPADRDGRRPGTAGPVLSDLTALSGLLPTL